MPKQENTVNQDLLLKEALQEPKASINPESFTKVKAFVDGHPSRQKADLKKSIKHRPQTMPTRVNPPAPEQEENFLSEEGIPCIEEVVAGEWKMPHKTPPIEKPLLANMALPAPPVSPEDNYILRDEITFERITERVFVNVIAINKNDSAGNSPLSIPAEGDPLGGYAYTPESDQYLVVCHDYFPLGTIPMAFRLVVKGYNGKMVVPLPEGLITRNASPSQKKALKAFKERYPDYVFEFVQSLYRS